MKIQTCEDSIQFSHTLVSDKKSLSRIMLGEIYFHFSLRPLQMPVVDELAAFSAAYLQSSKSNTKVCMDSKGTCTSIVIRVES